MTARKKQNGAAAEVAASAKPSGPDQLTVEDVMKVLEENGIRDLQQFIKRELARAKAADKVPSRASMLGPAAAKPSRRGPPQRPVKVPVLIDGVLHDPKDVHRFDGQILHFVGPTPTRPTLRAFTGDQWPAILRTYVQTRNASSMLQWANIVEGGPGSPTGPGGVEPPASGGVVIEPPPPPAAFFSDSNFEGDWLWLNRGMEWRDLTQVDRGDFWNRQSWNDCISSVSPVPNLGLVVLCEDINLGGASLSVPFAARDLGLFGWNDRTSSIVYW
jgi:hypothetical protein